MIGKLLVRLGVKLLTRGLAAQGYDDVRLTITSDKLHETLVARRFDPEPQIQPLPIAKVEPVQFVVSLFGSSDDMIVGVFGTELAAREFIAKNPPRDVQGEDAVTAGPLAEAYDIYGIDWASDEAHGYTVTKIVLTKPVAVVHVTRDDYEAGTWNALAPLFPTHNSPQE